MNMFAFENYALLPVALSSNEGVVYNFDLGRVVGDLHRSERGLTIEVENREAFHGLFEQLDPFHNYR